jgi:hypothetical protein
VHQPKRRAADDALLALVLVLGSVRQRSRAVVTSSRIRSRSSSCPSRSAQAFSARPEHADRVGLPVQRSGVAIERYWWIRAKAIGCSKVSLPVGEVGFQRPVAVRDAARIAGEHRTHCSSSNPATFAVAARSERARLLAVGVVGGVDDLLGRDEVVEAEQVDRAPDRGVEEDLRLAAEARSEPPRSAIPRGSMIRCASG